jgi:branched-chain amino acid transport system substrate-binding protein
MVGVESRSKDLNDPREETMRNSILSGLAVLAIAAGSGGALAQNKYDAGVTDKEIKIGNVMPYSGPASAYAVIGRIEAAYFQMINQQGGINGRRLNFISYDDGYSPPKTVEQVRRLVESDQVLLLFNVVGTPGNAAIQKYVNQKGIPHIFISSGASRWNDPAHFPWSMAWWPSFRTEARVYAKYIQQNHPGKTIGILYQNDDLGKDYLVGFREVFGAEASKRIVAEVSYELTDATVDSQIFQIKAAKPDIFLNISTPKFAAQAMRRVGELGWKPIQFLSNVSASVEKVMIPAGPDNARDVITATYMKDPTDPQWKDDPGMNEYRAFAAKHFPDPAKDDGTAVFGYGAAMAMTRMLKQCGDPLTRDNIMKQMTSLDMEIDVYLPGIRIRTSPTSYAPINQLQLMKFNGQRFELFGSVIGGD